MFHTRTTHINNRNSQSIIVDLIHFFPIPKKKQSTRVEFEKKKINNNALGLRKCKKKIKLNFKIHFQWLGDSDLRHRMQGRLILVHLMCRDMAPFQAENVDGDKATGILHFLFCYCRP